MPAAPPASARIRLSVRSWRRRRAPLAPIAARTASSCWRWQLLAMTRLATFAQAIRSTTETAARRISSGVRVRSPSTCVTGCVMTPQPRLNGGYSEASWRRMVLISASASATLAPGATRPITMAQCGARAARGVPGVKTAGTKNESAGNSQAPAGRTPMTVRGISSRTIRRPTTDRSPPKCDCQSSSVITTTSFRPPVRSSSGRNPRPRSGGIPSTRKNSWETSSPTRRSGGPSPRRLKRTGATRVRASKRLACVRQSRKTPPATLFCPLVSFTSDTITRRSGSGYGSGRRSTASSTL